MSDDNFNTTFGFEEKENYPIIECDTVDVDIMTLISLLTFFLGFGSMSAVVIVLFSGVEDFSVLYLVPFIFASLAAGYILIRNIYRYCIVKFSNIDLDGEVVYLFDKDDDSYNGNERLFLKIKCYTEKGYVYLLYDVGMRIFEYTVGDKVKLKQKDNLYLLLKK